MELPDCPPGAEGYQDTFVEMPKRQDADDSTCTKAELEFKEHLNSLKIKVEDGSTRCMVERRGRDVSGKWIYLCYPCAAVCSGESILQTHISGKKHKTKLALKNVWPTDIFQNHPYIKNEKGENPGNDPSQKTLQKMADVVSMHNLDTSALDTKYSKYRHVPCQIQEAIDKLKTPLLGVEYLIEFPPDEPHHEPSYICLLCNKQGAPRTIINHMVCHWHRIHYLWRHFPTTHGLLHPYRNNSKFREGVAIVMSRLVQRIEECYGRLKPLCIDKDEFNRDKDQISQWVFKGYHFSEKSGNTFAEVVDTDLINSLAKDAEAEPQPNNVKIEEVKKKDPSPPVVPAPSHPQKQRNRRERRPSADSLSDLSLDEQEQRHDSTRYHSYRQNYRDRPAPYPKRFSPGRERDRGRDRERGRERESYRHRVRDKDMDRGLSERLVPKREGKYDIKGKHSNLDYKMKVAAESRRNAELSAGKILAYHEKNPEKHPLYPEEWKRFWNRRYKELQTEGKDPSKHDFKPEWIVFWTKRMKELHDEELVRTVAEIYRKMNLATPLERSRRSRTPPRHRSRSPLHRSRSPLHRSRSPLHRSRSPLHRNRSPAFRKEPTQNPYRWRREDHKEERKDERKSLSPLSIREARMRQSRSHSRAASRSHTTIKPSPIKDTVLISDDELKDDVLSPWNGSGGSLDSLGSLPDAKSPAASHTGSFKSKHREIIPPQSDSPDDVVSSLRLLVALEDYLGSLGPKVIDLLTLALKMEKEKPNSSEQLLENELSVSLIETAKEKLKGAIQAGLVLGGAAAAARKAVTRAAALLHEADKRAEMKKKEPPKDEGVAVAGVGAVDKAAIAKQMAAALIAQGKTDVTTEELAQLVDAVVGMAEAKKREAEKASSAVKPPAAVAAPVAAPVIVPAVRASQASVQEPSASALQMLQSAYDENEKKMESEEPPDMMDGLSDSDLKTLLQNFAELSAEEQHGLIAYLKKLEAKDPRRVEKLREFVSAAVSAGPASEPPATSTAAPASIAPMQPPRPPPPPKKVVAPVTSSTTAAPVLTIDSDDEDYSVEEVFKSAAEKIKENQMRQEMEAVKKLLSQEPKSKETQLSPETKNKVEAATNPTSAANLLALMQASVHNSTKPILNNTTEVSTPTEKKFQSPFLGDKSKEAGPQPIIPSNSPLGMHLTQHQQHFGNAQSLNQNYANQAPLSGPTGTNHGPDQHITGGTHGMNQQGYENQIQNFRDTNQSMYGNQGPIEGSDGMQQKDYGNEPPMGGNMNANYDDIDESYQQDYGRQQNSLQYGQGASFQGKEMNYQQDGHQWGGHYGDDASSQGNYSNYEQYGGGGDEQSYPPQQYNNTAQSYNGQKGYGRGNFNNFRGNNAFRGGAGIRGRGGRGRSQRGANYY